MSNSFRIRPIFAFAPAFLGRIRDLILLGARLVFWPLAMLTLVSLALQLGAWHAEFKIVGPFAAETNPPRASLVVEVPQEKPAPWWMQPLVGDDAANPFQSFLELRINGREMAPHSLHETIRTGRTTSFSHWGSSVIFSLPEGMNNSSEAIATLRYSVRPRDWITAALTALSVIIAWFLSGRYARLTIALPGLILVGLCVLGLIGSAVYVGSSVYALATGWALPTTALIRWSPIAQWAVRNEPYLGYLLLTLAGLGALVSWLRKAGDNPQLRRFLAWCGFPIAVCAFTICISTMWTGMLRPGDPVYSNVGGLIPFQDAADYLSAAHDQAKDGFWNEVALRRPLAAAFRSALLVFGYFSLPLMLVLQAFLVAAATCFAANAVARWRGIWAGVSFFALTYIYARYFVPTTLTEPLGLFWALLSIPFFIEAFRSRSANAALVAFAMTTVALMTRMGSMFTLPALLIWLVWQFGQGVYAKLRIFAAACGILLGILGLSALLQNVYGSGPQPITGNFSYVACGLTIGTTWDGCLNKLASEGRPFPKGEEARTNLLYSMAWENFRAKPSVFFNRLASGAEEFVTRLPSIIWRGYGGIPEPNWVWRNTLTAICLIGLFYGAVRRLTALEVIFWMFVWASIVASASIIYLDDGVRTFAASLPLIALFFAMGMGDRSVPAGQPPCSCLSRYGALGLIVAAVVLAGVPWIAHRFTPVSDILIAKKDEAFVFSGRRMSGFLIVADGQPLRKDIPSLHFSDFDAIVTQSNMELYQDLIHSAVPHLPFGFVFAPRMEKGIVSSTQFIVPAEVLEQPNMPAWHFKLEPWQHRPDARGRYWFYVAKAAEPWP